MRRIALLVGGLGLASCSVVTEPEPFRPAVRHPQAASVTLAPVAALVSSPTVDPSTSIMAYHDDLEACRRSAAARLKSGASLDDVEALKRAVADGPGRGTVSVSYRSDDLAVLRDRAVKTCLSKRGYVLKD